MDTENTPPVTPRRRRVNTGRLVAIGGSLLLGAAAAGAALLGPATVAAQSNSASASPAASTTPSTTPSTGGTSGQSGTAPCGPGQADGHGFGGRGMGLNHEAVTDTSVAARAIGISESDLTAALAKGQTIAAVAKANNVDVQKVIDALVTDAQNELATAVKNGQITQAQADAQKAAITQRVTDQVNGTFGPGGHGFGSPMDGSH